MTELDVIGALYGTDKSSSVSWAWDYLRHYEELFSRWRHEPINVIEIGVLGGASLATWRHFFEAATLVGMDINPDCRRLARDRVVIEIGSQDDPGFLHKVAGDYPPTIVIDDGSHIAHHMIITFEALFPALRPGGIYVFEDLAFHFEDGGGQWLGAKAHQGLAATSMYEYLSPFIRARAANVAAADGSWGFSRYAFEHIDSITVFGGCLAVRKKATRNLEPAVAAFESELTKANFDRRTVSFRYAEFLLAHGHDLDRAAQLLQGALVALPPIEHKLNLFFRVMNRLDRLDEAAAAARKLVGLDRANSTYWDWLADVSKRQGDGETELVALRGLVQLKPNFGWYHHRLSQALERQGNLLAASVAACAARDLEPRNPAFLENLAAIEQRAGSQQAGT